MTLAVTQTFVSSFLGIAFVTAKVTDSPADIRRAIRGVPGPTWFRQLWPPRGSCLCAVAVLTLPGGGVRESRCSIYPYWQEIHFPQDVSRAMVPIGKLTLVRTEWAEQDFLHVAPELRSEDTRQAGSCCVG